MQQTSRRSSQLKLIGFFGLLLLGILLLGLWFRDRLRPPGHAQLAQLATVEFEPDDVQRWLADATDLGPLGGALSRDMLGGDFIAVTDGLERTPAAIRHPGLQLLGAVAYLRQQRPSRALVWLESVRADSDQTLVRDADWYLVQALLILGRRAEAEAMISRLQESPGRWQLDASELLLKIAEL